MSSSPHGEGSAGAPVFRLPDSSGEFRWRPDEAGDDARPLDPLSPEHGDVPNGDGASRWAAWAGMTGEEMLDAGRVPVDSAPVVALSQSPPKDPSAAEIPQAPPATATAAARGARAAGRDPRDGAYTLPALIAILVVTMAASLFMGQGLRWPGGVEQAPPIEATQAPKSSIFADAASAPSAVAAARPEASPPVAAHPHPSSRSAARRTHRVRAAPPAAPADLPGAPAPPTLEAAPPPDLTSGAAAPPPVPEMGPAAIASGEAPATGAALDASAEATAPTCVRTADDVCASAEPPSQVEPVAAAPSEAQPAVGGPAPVVAQPGPGLDPGVAVQPPSDERPPDAGPSIGPGSATPTMGAIPSTGPSGAGLADPAATPALTPGL